MKITCWGSRGTVPVAGADYIRYGGDTTCLQIENGAEDTILIVDAGTGIRRLGRQLLEGPQRTCHLLFTHAHWDHIMGLPYFLPLWRKHFKVSLHHCPFHDGFVDQLLPSLLTPPYFPVPYNELSAHVEIVPHDNKPFHIGSLQITPIALSHPDGGAGYRFDDGAKSFVFLTDNELAFQHPGGHDLSSYARFCEGVDLLIHDAEFTPDEYHSVRTWGHSRYTDAVDLALGAGVRRLGLFHLNQDRTDDRMDDIVQMANKMARKRTECFGVAVDLSLRV